MADIARETGLTLGTVSRALNTEGKYAISPETRERVAAVASRLGYRPNLIGRALAARSTGLILLVSPDPFAPYYVEVSRHLSAQADRYGYSFVTGGALPKASDGGIPANDWLYGVDGMVVCDCLPHQEAYVAEALRLKIPVVGLGVRDPFPTDFVRVDLYRAARELMAHFAEQGCRRPALLASPGAETDDPRHRAYWDALAEADQDERFVKVRNQSRAAAREAVVEAYRTEPFDALFCENDLMAVGALRGLTDLGVRVPEEVCLAGCDGLEEARYRSVPITSIVQPLEAMCVAAWTMLQTRIEGDESPARTEAMTAILEIRASSLRKTRKSETVFRNS